MPFEHDITFLGDVWLPSRIQNRVSFCGHVILNLESPITTATSAIPNKIALRVKSNLISETFGAKTSVTLANNHIMDYGSDGLSDTIRSLRAHGLSHCGAGTSLLEASVPLTLGKPNGPKTVVIAASTPLNSTFATSTTPGVLPAVQPMIGEMIQTSKSAGHRVVVAVHWGQEEVFLPRKEDVILGRSFVDDGADLVIGHHTHVIQPIEKYKDKFIFYGLGNAVFPSFSVPIYGADGTLARTAKKTQLPRNQHSLAVTFSPLTCAVRVSKFRFSNETLTVVGKNVTRKYMRSLKVHDYERMFAREVLKMHFSVAFQNFIRAPRIPTLAQMRYLMNALLKRTPRCGSD